METDSHKTMVVFKTSRSGWTTIAMFPCQEIWHCSNIGDRTVKSYWSNLDSFSESSPLFINIAYRKATDEEAAPVKAALEEKGYNLAIWRRMPSRAERHKWIEAGNK